MNHLLFIQTARKWEGGRRSWAVPCSSFISNFSLSQIWHRVSSSGFIATKVRHYNQDVQNKIQVLLNDPVCCIPYSMEFHVTSDIPTFSLLPILPRNEGCIQEREWSKSLPLETESCSGFCAVYIALDILIFNFSDQIMCSEIYFKKYNSIPLSFLSPWISWAPSYSFLQIFFQNTAINQVLLKISNFYLCEKDWTNIWD